jgi:hypothetical protein
MKIMKCVKGGTIYKSLGSSAIGIVHWEKKFLILKTGEFLVALASHAKDLRFETNWVWHRYFLLPSPFLELT